MSLLRRLEGAGGPARPPAPTEAPPAQTPPPPSQAQKPPAAPPPPPPATATRGVELGPARGSKEWIKELKGRIQDRLIRELDPKLDVKDREKVSEVVSTLF